MKTPKECRYNVGVICADGPERCRRCGWNPEEDRRRKEWINRTSVERYDMMIAALKRWIDLISDERPDDVIAEYLKRRIINHVRENV